MNFIYKNLKKQKKKKYLYNKIALLFHILW